jgi:hypothetical protein
MGIIWMHILFQLLCAGGYDLTARSGHEIRSLQRVKTF